MGKIVLVTSGKGGTGKTTVALNLGLSLAIEGKRAVILELDSGLRCLDLMLGIDNIVYDLGDVLSGRCEFQAAIYEAEFMPELSVIAAPAKSGYVFSKERLRTLCSHLCSVYDCVILDTPAGIGQELFAAASACNLALAVSTLSPVSVRDAEKTVMALCEAGVKKIRLVINFVPLEIEDKKEIPDLDDVIDTVGVQLISVIPEDDVLKKCIAQRTLKDFKKSVGILAFGNLAKRIMGQDVPLLFE